jgi:hypothetical protein
VPDAASFSAAATARLAAFSSCCSKLLWLLLLLLLLLLLVPSASNTASSSAEPGLHHTRAVCEVEMVQRFLQSIGKECSYHLTLR